MLPGIGSAELLQWVAGFPSRERRVYSQNGEDGVLEHLFSRIGTTNKFYAEFGVEDCTECNSRYLRTKGWSGLLMDGSNENASINLHKEVITVRNVASLLRKYSVPSELDLLSIDTDCFDWWLLLKLFRAEFRPRAVIVEVNSHASMAPPIAKVVRYRPGKEGYCSTASQRGGEGFTTWFGGSVSAFWELFRHFNYSMVYCESQGVNCMAVRDDVLGIEGGGRLSYSLSDVQLYQPPMYGPSKNGHPVDPHDRPFDDAREILGTHGCPSVEEVLTVPLFSRWHEWEDSTCASGCRLPCGDLGLVPCCVISHAKRNVRGAHPVAKREYYQSNWHPGAPEGSQCAHIARAGARADGGKMVCFTHLPQGLNAVVLSVGSGGDFSFETDIHDALPNARITTLVGFVTPAMAKKAPPFVRFEHLNFTRQFRLRGLNHIDIAKIDCEGCELTELLPWLEHVCVEQLLIETHACNQPLESHHRLMVSLNHTYGVFHKEPNIQHSDGTCVEFGLLRRSPCEGGHYGTQNWTRMLDRRCDWKYISAPSPSTTRPYAQCLRKYPDLLSDSIKRDGRWADCDALADLWRRMKAVSGCHSVDRAIFVDAGANIGSCSLLMLSLGVVTHAFEPLEKNLFYLNASLSRNPGFETRAHLHAIGLGEAKRTMKIFSQRGNIGNSVLGTPVTDFDGQGHLVHTPVTVRVGTLDGELWPNSRDLPPCIPLMKMDVQGFEVKLLTGARRLLAAGAIRAIKFEVALRWIHAQNSSAAILLKALRDYNYVILRPQPVRGQNAYAIFTPRGDTQLDVNATNPYGVADFVAVQRNVLWNLLVTGETNQLPWDSSAVLG